MKLNTIYYKRNWEFCLLERGFGDSHGTEYKLTSGHLDVQVVNKEINGDNLVLACIIPSGDERPLKIGRRDMVRINQQPEVANEDLLRGFRGSILGYPNVKLLVHFSDNSFVSCDVIKILGGQREKFFNHYSLAPFIIEFYKFNSNGKLELVKTVTDNTCRFRIEGEEINGQIPSGRGAILNSYCVIDSIYSYHHEYYNRNSDYVNVTEDSKFSFLSFDIDLKRQLLFLSYEENLKYNEYEVISYASMDGNDKGYESIDRYLWATYRFKSSYHLMKIINQIIQISDIVQHERRNKRYLNSMEYSQMFKFKKVMSKTEFESKTGIHLFESIETKNSHY